MVPRYFTHLRCSRCPATYPASTVQTVCRDCGQTLLAEYDLDLVRRRVNPSVFAGRTRSLWRYRELLPPASDRNCITLGEGWTPLLEFPALGRDLGIPGLLIKDESFNPTGSFKARGISLAVSMAAELGIRQMGMPSAGNAGGALAAYAARAGMEADIWVPSGTPAVNIREAELYGASVHIVQGDISTAASAMRAAAHPEHWLDTSTMREPYRLEGKKTMGYEIAEQLGWNLPDAVIYPTGGGTGLIGIWKAVQEMEALGWIRGQKPRMVCVQAAGCAPVVEAFRKGEEECRFRDHARTLASGLRVPKPFADRLILSAIRESGGTAVSVTDEEILAAMREVARKGLFICPEGAATIPAVRKLVNQGFLRPSDRVLILNTGTGYKYTELYLRV